MELARDILAIIGGCTMVAAIGLGLGLLLDHPAIMQEDPEDKG